MGTQTLFFEQHLDWRGILVEANPLTFPRLVANRKKTINLHTAFCTEECGGHIEFIGTADTHHDVGGDLKTMNKAHRDNFWANKNNAQIFNVSCAPLSRYLALLGVKHIDFFSLDVEGGEFEVLRTIDFGAVQIDVFLIELDGIA